MSKKTIVLLSFLFISPVLLYFLWPSDENRIRKLFREGAAAVENENIDDVMAKVSLTYSDEHGLSYIILKRGFERSFKQMDDFEVSYTIETIQVAEKSASAEISIRVIATYGQERGYVVGDANEPVRMSFSLEKERVSWLVTRAAGLPDYLALQ